MVAWAVPAKNLPILANRNTCEVESEDANYVVLAQIFVHDLERHLLLQASLC